jgi:rhomboid protease GluP
LPILFGTIKANTLWQIRFISRAEQMSETGTIASQTTASVVPVDTFSHYLARQFISKKGFTPGTVPEAEELTAASDVVLTLHGGAPFTILCLVDRDAHPGKEFALQMPVLEKIAEQCLKYSYKTSAFGSSRMPVVIRVIECGPTSADQLERLETIKPPSLTSKCRAAALAVDTASGSVWSSSRFDKPERAFVEAMLRAPRQPDAEIAPFVTVELPPKITPVVTFGLIGLLALIFVAELSLGVGPPASGIEPSIRTLIALGGLQYLLTVDQGQWYRIFSGPLLHGNLIHILLNGIALLLAGYALERAVGRLWFAALFVIGALGGACGSLLVNPHNLVSVGASGAIMGLFAAALVVSFRYTNGLDRLSIQRRAIQVLIPSLLPLASAAKADRVDYGAHAGGAIAGAVAGYALLKFWRKTDVLPGYRRTAISIIALGLIGTLAAGIAIPLKYRFWVAASQLIPSAQLPKSDLAINEFTVKPFLEKYPNDPRSHFYEAIVLMGKHDLPGAERELRTALAAEYVMKEILAPPFNLYVQNTLALVLSDQHRTDEARQAAAAGCLDQSSQLFGKLQAAGLCTNPGQ